jgi:hypothetical protein
LAAIAILINVLFMQSGSHPAPMFKNALAAKVPTMKPTASRGLHPITRNGYQPLRPSISSSTGARFPRPTRAV